MGAGEIDTISTMGLLLAQRSRTSHSGNPMLPQVKWWRAKATTLFEPGRADWLEPTNSYPGFVVTQPASPDNVRLFRDLDAFKLHDGAYSVDLPLDSVDEVSEAREQPPTSPELIRS